MIASGSKTDFLDLLRKGLRRVSEPDRGDIVREIDNHFEEARAEGRSDADVIAALGDPRKLALAYELELFGARCANVERQAGSTDRLLVLIPVVAALSLPTLVVVAVLGSLALAFSIAGVALTIGAFFLAAGVDPAFINWRYSTELAFVGGPIMALTGFASGYILYRYLRATARALRKLIPHPVSRRA
jgi:uncharacterized membrane protein